MRHAARRGLGLGLIFTGLTCILPALAWQQHTPVLASSNADSGVDGQRPLIAERAAAGAALGHDVIVCSLQESGLTKWGVSGSIAAYSIPTTSGNAGSVDLPWIQINTLHPVIGQNMYRLANGRMEQIGMSWLKHGFCALQIPGGCVTGCEQTFGCETYLSVGCTDPYNGSRNGSAGSTLGPHWQVNAWTGEFTYPPAPADPIVPSIIRRRLQVRLDDLDPALNSGALYFGEGMYIHLNDAQDLNHYNNASHRQFTVGEFTAGQAPTLTWSGPTQVMSPAVQAWQDADPSVLRTQIDVPGEGRFLLYAAAADNGNGTWRYEYALYNMNSERSAARFSVPLPKGVTASNAGFHDVDYHSGEPYSLLDWNFQPGSGELSWQTDPYVDNANANALRWGTTYNFRFEANSPPAAAEITMGLFKPAEGQPDEVSATTLGPGAPLVCPADFDGNAAVGPPDLAVLLGAWGANPGHPADIDQDGAVSPTDLALLLGAWGPCAGSPGACCHLNGSGACAVVLPAVCAMLAGQYLGDATSCGGCPPAVCGPGAGDCCTADDTPGCEQVTCCDAVCAVMPSCCETAWDAGCVLQAESVCQVCGVPPVNDSCAGSVVVFDGKTPFDTTNATTDGPAHDVCQFDGQTYHDIWYDYSAACSGELAVSTCGLADYDTDLVIYGGCDCDNLAVLDCSDDAPDCPGFTSTLLAPVLAGNCYKIRVGGFGQSFTGQGTLSITCDDEPD